MPVTSTFPLRFVTDTILRSPDVPMTSQLRKYYRQVSLTLTRIRIPVVVVQMILHYLFDEEPSRQYFDWTKPAPLALANEYFFFKKKFFSIQSGQNPGAPEPHFKSCRQFCQKVGQKVDIRRCSRHSYPGTL